MDIVCPSCRGRLTLPENKLPQARAFSLACPKCKNKITVERPEESPAGEADVASMPELAAEAYDAAEKPFDFIEEGVETALVCEADPAVGGKLATLLDGMGYRIVVPRSAIEALKHMRYHLFDLIVLNERFDARRPGENNILRYLEQLTMAIRRNIFVALLSERYRTMDNMAAFRRSVDLVINLKHLDQMEKILKRGLSDRHAFYRVFREALVKAGKG
jgi:uncharacterized protein YbaR (Trm112 family)